MMAGSYMPIISKGAGGVITMPFVLSSIKASLCEIGALAELCSC